MFFNEDSIEDKKQIFIYFIFLLLIQLVKFSKKDFLNNKNTILIEY